MKLEKFLCLCAIAFFISCGSNKKAVRSSRPVQKRRPVKVSKTVEKKEVKKPIVKSTPAVVSKPKEVEVVKATPAPVKKSYSDVTQGYIDTYSSVAIREMHAYKIPASITLAQGVLESGSGRSELAMKSNNHFGIKCHKGWKGNSVSHDDDALGECFRKYQHPKTSYEDHSKFLTSRSRYANLFKLNINDYVGWAHGLRKAGYATDPKYPNKLIAIINKYDLDQYDLVSKQNNTISVEEYTTVESQSTYYKVKKGDTLYSISRRYNKTVEELKKRNNLRGNALSVGQELLID